MLGALGYLESPIYSLGAADLALGLRLKGLAVLGLKVSGRFQASYAAYLGGHLCTVLKYRPLK